MDETDTLSPPSDPLADASSGASLPKDQAEGMRRNLQLTTQRYTDKLADIQSTREKGMAGLEAQKGALKPPPPLAPVPPPSAGGGVAQAFGAAALGMFLFGSKLTRKHTISSMNSAAAMINGFTQGQKEATHEAYSQWKAESENALNMHAYEMEIYQNALRGITDKEGKLRQASEDETKTAEAQMKAYFSAMGNDRGLLAMENNGIKGAQAEIDRQKKAADHYQENFQKWTNEKLAADEWEKIQKTPEYLNAGATTKREMFNNQIIDKYKPKAEAEKAKVKASQDQLEVAQSSISAALDLNAKSYTAGLMGKANTAWEIAAPILSMDQYHPTTEAHDYSRNIDAAKASLNLLKAGGRSNAQFRTSIDHLAEDISYGQSQDTQRHSLMILGNLIARMQGKPTPYKEVEKDPAQFLPGDFDTDLGNGASSKESGGVEKTAAKPGASEQDPIDAKDTTQEDYDAAPSGTWFRAKNGQAFPKP